MAENFKTVCGNLTGDEAEEFIDDVSQHLGDETANKLGTEVEDEGPCFSLYNVVMDENDPDFVKVQYFAHGIAVGMERSE